MAIDLRLRYDRATKERAAAMFAEGLRPAAVAAATDMADVAILI